MRKNHEEVDDDLIEEPEEGRAQSLSEDEFGLFDDDDPAPSDRRRDPLRKHGGFVGDEES